MQVQLVTRIARTKAGLLGFDSKLLQLGSAVCLSNPTPAARLRIDGDYPPEGCEALGSTPAVDSPYRAIPGIPGRKLYCSEERIVSGYETCKSPMIVREDLRP